MNGTHAAWPGEGGGIASLPQPPKPVVPAAVAALSAGPLNSNEAAGSSPVETPVEQQAGGLPPQPPSSGGSNADQPFTFTFPFTAAAELRRSGSAPGAESQAATPSSSGEIDAGSRRISGGVLRSVQSDPNRMRRNVSWPDLENQAPLAQVVEYEPSSRHDSIRSEDDWGSPRSSGCLCCIQ